MIAEIVLEAYYKFHESHFLILL
jgi:WD40 repeat protein